MTDLTLDAYKALPLREVEKRLQEERIKILGLERGFAVRSVAFGKGLFCRDERPFSDTKAMSSNRESESG